MIELLLFLMASLGLTIILVESDISENTFKKLIKFFYKKLNSFLNDDWKKKIEWLPKGLECHLCMGFWAGCFSSYIFLTDKPLEMICCGFASSFINSFYINIVGYIQSQTVYNLPDEEKKIDE